MEAFVTKVADYLVSQSWQLPVVFVLVASACWGLRKRSAHWRYLLWLIVLAKCLVPGMIGVPLAILPQKDKTQATPALSRPAQIADMSPALKSAADVTDATKPEMTYDNSRPVLSAPKPASSHIAISSVLPTAEKNPGIKLTMRNGLLLAWFTGMVLFLTYLSIRAWTIHRQLNRYRQTIAPEMRAKVTALAKQLKLKVMPTVYMADGIAQPFVWGWFRGCIYLPKQFLDTATPEQQQAILTHELAHIARWDAAMNLLQVVVQAVFFFHPLIWWTNRQIRREREKCCDEFVLASLVASPNQYSQAIVNALVTEYESDQPIPSLAIAGRLKNIEERIQTILNPKGRFYRRPSWIAVATVACLTACAVPTALVLTARGGSADTQPASTSQQTPPSQTSTDGAAKTNSRWLEGSDKDLRIKIIGEVLDEHGEPAKGCQLELRLETHFGERSLPAVFEGNRFELWVPIGNVGWWFTLHMSAKSADGGQIAREMIRANTIRQAAIDGVTLRMKKPERTVEVTVVENGQKVANAFVAADFEGERITGKTNDAGVATFAMMKHDTLSYLTAWTEEFKIGGYSFDRDPPRDPLADKYSIELEKCRSQTIRVINEEDQSPVPNLDFVLIVGSGEPDYQYLGKTPDCEMRTDTNGEAVYRRFPDWKKHGSYIEIRDPHWFKSADVTMVDGKMLVKLRKSQFDKRKHVVGKVTSPDSNVAGLYVSLDSFQGEEKNNRDVLLAFTDEHGQFAADYLPGATYCVCIDDATLVSNIIDVLPFEPTMGKTNNPSLEISKGQPVEIVATTGPERRPLAHQYINLTTIHEYSWNEDGKTHHGIGGRTWQVFTDEQGKVTTLALAGKKLQGSLYSPQWRAQESVIVKAEGVTRLEFHRKVADKRKITGQLIPADHAEADLKDAIIEIGSIDGETNERLTLKAGVDGKFAFESQASRIGIYAHTKDGKTAVVSILDHCEGPIELRLKPLGEYHGQLLGKNDIPLGGHAVRASLTVAGKRDYSKPNPTSFHAATFETKTDDQGKYTLKGLPCEVALQLVADSLDGSKQGSNLGEFYLVPNESRPLDVSRLWSKPAAKISFAERYARVLRDCRLGHFQAMVILFSPSKESKQFADVNLMDYEKTEEVASFIQLQGQIDDKPATAEIVEFAKSKNWPTPAEEKVFACALDATGKELGRVEFDIKAPDSSELAAKFVRQYALPKEDAIKKWDDAFSTAKQTHRKVWVRVSQRYCGPCFLLARWLDDHKEILEQDYVLLKIDDWHDLHGEEVAKRLTGDEHYGIPFYAIFDPDGRMLITSASPMGNIGFPSSFEDKKHLRKMLTQTCSKLTDKQIDELIASVND